MEKYLFDTDTAFSQANNDFLNIATATAFFATESAFFVTTPSTS